MGNTVPIDTVKAYLLRIKFAVVNGNYRFTKRKKNLESMTLVGILPRHIKEHILGLTYLDYFNGPEAERNPAYPAGEYLFFGCNIEGYEFFIKIKLENNGGDDFCICISFHIAESKIHYAYR